MKKIARKFVTLQFCTLVLLSSLSEAVAQSNEAGTRWDHRGSTMRLFTLGDTGRRFHYETPSANMATLVRKGEILFDGNARGMNYEGTAYTFSSKCGRAGYRVEGLIAPDYRSVTLRGKFPRRGDDCEVKEYTDVTLTFEFREKVVAPDRDFVNAPDVKKGFAARTYLRDPASGNEIILDWLDFNTLKGELLDKNGSVVAVVSGKNPRPRALELTFKVKSGSTSSATYIWLVDEYDETREEMLRNDRNFLAARWFRTLPDGTTPASLRYCRDDCRAPPPDSKDDFRFSEVVSWRGSSFRSQNAGEVCIQRAEDLPAALALLRKEGLEAKVPRDSDGCIEVPIGLEAWAIKTLNTSGKVRDARHGYGTSGGSGTVTQEFSPGTFVPASLTPHNRAEVWKQSACKLRSALNQSFRLVDIKPCDTGAKLGMCFTVSLEGHTAEEGGFSTNLNRLLDNKFLVRSELEFEATLVLTQFSPVNYVERLEWHVIRSEFARQTKTAPSADSVFKEVEHFQLKVSSAFVDRTIAAIVQQLIMVKSPLTCNAS